VGQHILVVNTDQGILDLFHDLLSEEGYTVTCKRYAEVELRAVEALTLDLIILDLVVGGEAEGWTLLSKLRLLRSTATIPVVVCMYFPGPHILRDPYLEAEHVLVAPMPPNLDRLLQVIAQALVAPERVLVSQNGVTA
jgi:CheY-like chemotaxis protein